MTTYRPMTDQEIIKTAYDLKEYVIFLTYVDMATKLYGPTVYQIDIDTDANSDDEGGLDWRLTDICARDKDGKRLPVIATLEKLAELELTLYDEDKVRFEAATDDDERAEIFWECVRDSGFLYGVEAEDRPDYYKVDQPPKLLFKTLYVPVEEGA